MLRHLLLLSPLALALVSCGDSSPTFDDSHLPGSIGSGASSGTTTDPTMNDASGATSDSAGTTNSGGSSNGQAGTPSHGGTSGGGKGNQAGSGGTGSSKGGASSGGGSGGGSSGGSETAGNGSGGSDNNSGGTAGTSASAGTAAGGTATGGSSGSGGMSGGGMPGGGMPGGGMPGGGMPGGGWGGWGCPDVTGDYAITSAEGACNGFNRDAAQSIQDFGICSVRFVSDSLMGNSAINGNASLDKNGDFSGTVLYFGKNVRSACSGNWNDVDQTMTVKCGFQNDACTVVLERQ